MWRHLGVRRCWNWFPFAWRHGPTWRSMFATFAVTTAGAVAATALFHFMSSQVGGSATPTGSYSRGSNRIHIIKTLIHNRWVVCYGNCHLSGIQEQRDKLRQSEVQTVTDLIKYSCIHSQRTANSWHTFQTTHRCIREPLSILNYDAQAWNNNAVPCYSICVC
jgi:hypothetical protein